ncbi:NAD-dependent epimerase/dehydratase [Actinobacteria bacterium OK074]|nr:NAD-dependent epimerase/dehydratase [Actinobacteria bacterium OK074]
MRVFVTGATGYIGSAVVRELVGAGHEVVGLARSEAAAVRLRAVGVGVHRGHLDDLDSLRVAAAAAEGVVHTAFTIGSQSVDRAASVRTEFRAVQALGAALEGTGRPLVVASGTLALAPGRLGTEEDPLVPEPIGGTRIRTEQSLPALARQGVRAVAVRLAPTVHGEGDAKGFLALLTAVARQRGVSAYVGDGANRWPAVHRSDAAHLFRLALESAEPGARVHAVAEEGVPFREIAEAVGRSLDVPTRGITAQEAGDHFGYLGLAVTLDNPTSSALTRQRLGWAPAHPTLVEDIGKGHYADDTTSC